MDNLSGLCVEGLTADTARLVTGGVTEGGCIVDPFAEMLEKIQNP